MNDPASLDSTKPNSPQKAYLSDSTVTGGQIYAYILNPQTVEVSPAAQQVARSMLGRHPEMRDMTQNSRAFVRRSSAYMVTQGISQFIDLGAGLPTDANTHLVVQRIEPHARVVYVDNDDITREQAHDLIADQENVNFIIGDAADVDFVLNHPETKELIDFTQPVGILMASIWHLITEEHAKRVGGAGTHDLVKRYIDALPSGSYIALEHFTDENKDQAFAADLRNEAGVVFRPIAEIRKYFDGLDLVQPKLTDDAGEPELIWSNFWRNPKPNIPYESTGSWIWAGVGRKP